MADRPILFSAPMVRAQRDGRKTMTRRALYRLITFKPGAAIPKCTCFRKDFPPPKTRHFGELWTLGNAAKYQVGDRLWVREAWDFLPCGQPGQKDNCEIVYWATGSAEKRTAPINFNPVLYGKERNRPSIHMPRWASRLTDTITAVRIERLQDISEADALAEGIDDAAIAHFGSPINAFAALWNSVAPIEELSWEANPWVVASTFTVGRHNIDEVNHHAQA